MGKAILNFDQMEILLKKSDSNHSDNDWIIIVWFRNGDVIRTDQMPLFNTAGSVILDSGNVIAPFSSEVTCTDTDFISATYVVVNLGSYDFADQAGAAEQFAKEVAKKLTELYVKAAQLVVANSGLPLGQVFADGLGELSPVIVDSVGALFDDVLIPAFNDLVGEIQILLGHPNCNGPVFNDIVLYPPYQPVPDMTIFKTYTSSPLSGCGSPAKTSVQITMQRDLDPVPQFANTPAPQVDTAPSQGESADHWLGSWAEDPNTPTPIIFVDITRSNTPNTFDVTIKEVIDPRYDVRFEASGKGLQPVPAHLFFYTGNVFGTLAPWINPSVGPGDLQVYHAGSKVKALSATQTSLPQPRFTGAAGLKTNVEMTPALKLTWNRPQSAGTPLSRVNLVSFSVAAAQSQTFLFETVQVLRIPEQGVTLGLYTFRANGTIIGHGVRYMRNASASFTRADVMLVHWNPLR